MTPFEYSINIIKSVIYKDKMREIDFISSLISNRSCDFRKSLYLDSL